MVKMKTKKIKIAFFTRFRNKIRLSGEDHSISISPSAKVRNCTLRIKGKDNILEIESGVNMRGCEIEIDGNNCSLIIGKGSIIGKNCYLSARENGTRLSIGENCMLSRNVKVMTSDGHDILKDNVRINPSKNISIGNHVWLADNTTILKGASIGDSSIIGINSTLTKPIPSNTIAAGNPAKVINNGVDWDENLTF